MKIVKLTTLLLLILTLKVAGQKVNKFIKQEEVTRIIQSLSADEMMGRDAMDEKSINKAAAFIEEEFRDIGLKPLSEAASFLQEFSIYNKIETTSLKVMIDGKAIASENIILLSDVPAVKLEINSPTALIEKGKELRASLRPFFNDSISKVVFVAPEYEKEFREIRSYISKARLTENGKSKNGSIVFVLSKPAADFSAEATQSITPFKLTNVVGVLEGKTLKDEMVVFSGHYDHLGIQSPTEGDSIANGADDDASGTTAVIELARYFKKIKNNKRTLIFVAFTAEEIGGFGSKYFSTQIDADKVMAMFNIEMIGKASKWGQNNAFITGFERSDFGEILQKNLIGTPFQFHPDPYPDLNLFYRSDNATLARLGVPAHSISTDQIDSDKLYHTVNDEVGSLDMANITSTIRAIALSSKTIVSGKETPKRIDKSTVK